MKAILNVDGKQLEVTNINLYQGKVTDVQVTFGNNVYKTYHDEKSLTFAKDALLVNMEEALEFPTIGQAVADKWKKLIEHLEELIVDEDGMLTHLALTTMNEELPFNESYLVDKQREYKQMQQRVNGVIDTVEEVKAFMEGWYRDDDTSATNETEVANQTT